MKGVAEELFRQIEEYGAGSAQSVGYDDREEPIFLVFCAVGQTAKDAMVVLKALEDHYANTPEEPEGGIIVTIEEADRGGDPKRS